MLPLDKEIRYHAPKKRRSANAANSAVSPDRLAVRVRAPYGSP